MPSKVNRNGQKLRQLGTTVFLVLSLASGSLAATTWKWIAYGDTRTNDAAHRSVLHAIQNSSTGYAFMINVGDVVEDGAQTSFWNIWQQACYDELGGTGQDQVPPTYMSAPGNHDNVNTDGLTNWNNYLSGQARRYGHQGKYFYFDYENARFIVLNSEEPPDSPQADMLKQALQTNTRTWLFAIWHRPIFDFDKKVYEKGLHDMWGVPLYQHGCDIIFTGHAHIYARSKKIQLNGEAHPPLDPASGTVQVVTGDGGAPSHSVDPNRDGNNYMLEYGQGGNYGYTELTMSGNHLTLKHIQSDGTLLDSATYTANPKPFNYTPTPNSTSPPSGRRAATLALTSISSDAVLPQAYPNPAQ